MEAFIPKGCVPSLLENSLLFCSYFKKKHYYCCRKDIWHMRPFIFWISYFWTKLLSIKILIITSSFCSPSRNAHQTSTVQKEEITILLWVHQEKRLSVSLTSCLSLFLHSCSCLVPDLFDTTTVGDSVMCQSARLQVESSPEVILKFCYNSWIVVTVKTNILLPSLYCYHVIKRICQEGDAYFTHVL